MNDDAVAAAIARVRRQFFEQGDTRVGPLRDAQYALVAEEPVCWSATHDAAHKIAGLAGTIGLPQLSDCARELETAILQAQAARTADLSGFANALGRLLDAWNDAEAKEAA